MTESTRVTIALNLGPNAPLASVASAVNDVAKVCDFAAQLQRIADRNEATYYVARRSRGDFRETFFGDIVFWIDERPSRSFGASNAFERTVESWLVENDRAGDADIDLVELKYSNPLELVIFVSGAVVLAVLRTLRDWSAKRELNQLAVSDYRRRVESRAQARAFILEELRSGEIRLSDEQIDNLLSIDVADALSVLGDSRIQVRGLDAPEE